MVRVAAILLALGLLAACGEETALDPGPKCTVYPDSCGNGDQCFPGKPVPEQTICLTKAPLDVGATCDPESEDANQWCGPELVCVGYGEDGATKRCSPLCKTDQDCQDRGIFEPCKPGAIDALRFCRVR
jgi:hypothetical protein